MLRPVATKDAHPYRSDSVAAGRGVRAPSLSEAQAPAPARRSVFGEVFVLQSVAERGGSDLSIARAEDVSRALRGALLRFVTDPAPAVLSGHEADGRPLDRPHVAFLALPGGATALSPAAVGGVAIVLPHEVTEEDRQEILLAAARWESSGARLVFGRLGAMRFARVEDGCADTRMLLAALSAGGDTGQAVPIGAPALTGPSRHWASLTPIALHRNPGNLAAREPATAARAVRDAEHAITDACGHIGLPHPIHVRVAQQSPFPGIPAAPAFMPYPRHGSGFKRVCVHAELEFAEPVQGPVVLGVGRYFGVGLFCALDDTAAGVGSHQRTGSEPQR